MTLEQENLILKQKLKLYTKALNERLEEERLRRELRRLRRQRRQYELTEEEKEALEMAVA